MVYDDRQPPPGADGPRPGCLETLLITRLVFGILFWPLAAIIFVVLDASVTFILYATHPLLALIPVGITAAAIWLLARWDQRRRGPPDA